MSNKAQSSWEEEITGGVNDWNTHTVIKFYHLGIYNILFPERIAWALNHHVRFVFSNKVNRCGASNVGMGHRPVNVTCGSTTSIRTIVHELGHVLGLYHEQQRPDRNAYVYVVEEQMSDESYRNNYKIYPAFNQPILPDIPTISAYDIHSVMHYYRQSRDVDGVPFYFFDKLPWIPGTLGPNERRFPDGSRTWLSRTDIALINHFYRER